jgi:hypothetical protein
MRNNRHQVADLWEPWVATPRATRPEAAKQIPFGA